MEFIFLLIVLVLFGFITMVFLGVGTALLSFLFMFFSLVVVGGVIYLIFGPWGLFAFIIIGILGSLANWKKGRRKSSKKKYKEWQKKDEELEDYDYLDDMTGRDDKPWI